MSAKEESTVPKCSGAEASRTHQMDYIFGKYKIKVLLLHGMMEVILTKLMKMMKTNIIAREHV